ncbi:MAG: TOBE domain-containing protein, partial [Thermomicrobiales bacterium]
MRELIARLHAEQDITTLLVTHDRQEAMTLAERVAFLSDGRLQQYGAAPELYERPATVAVAQFFGMTNLFPASITSGIARTALGPLRLVNGAGNASEAVVGIRPEHIALGAGENRVIGRITARMYLGQQQRVTLRASVTETDLTVLAPAELPLIVGQELILSLPPERLHIIACGIDG